VQLTASTKRTSQPYVPQRLVQKVVLLCSLISVWNSPLLNAAVLSEPPVESAATEAVKGTVTELIRVLDDTRLKAPERAEQRRHEIERVVMRRVSYEEMAQRALGTPWSELSGQERQEFVGLFVQLLRDTFAGRISERTDEQVVYLSEQREDQFAEVRTQLKGQKVDTLVDFRLLHASGDWLVYDVVIDGASIVSNYRAQFSSIIRDVTYLGLVKKMRQNAVAVKFFEQTIPH
jgi:phospholipid transport system substrate-binding protein